MVNLNCQSDVAGLLLNRAEVLHDLGGAVDDALEQGVLEVVSEADSDVSYRVSDVKGYIDWTRRVNPNRPY